MNVCAFGGLVITMTVPDNMLYPGLTPNKLWQPFPNGISHQWKFVFFFWLSFRWCPFTWLVHWHICALLVAPWDCSSSDSICFWLNVVYFWFLNTGAYPGGLCLFVFHTTSCLLGLRLSKYPEMISIWIIRRFLTDKCQHSSGTGETSSHLPTSQFSYLWQKRHRASSLPDSVRP